MTQFRIVIQPRETKTWPQFCENNHAIALDGYVAGGPDWNHSRKLVNFDHHDGVVREATMSTAKQVYFAIKQGFCSWMGPTCDVYVNDIDQDTVMAIWLLQNHALFEGTGSVPTVSRILELNDRLDITGGAFPMSLTDSTYGTHAWVFQPYTNLRTQGVIARASVQEMQACLESCCGRLTQLLMGTASVYYPNVVAKILQTGPITVLDETIHGIESRHVAFAESLIHGVYLSIVAKRDDGRFVYTLGKKSRYVDFDMKAAFDTLNYEEGHTKPHGWGGGDLIGGSDRMVGSSSTWQDILALIS